MKNLRLLKPRLVKLALLITQETMRHGLLTRASTSCSHLITAMQSKCLQQVEQLFRYGITRDQLHCRHLNGVLTRWQRLSSIQVRSIFWPVLPQIEAYVSMIFEETLQSTKYISKTSHLQFAGILKSPWTLWSEMKTRTATHLTWESQNKQKWSTKITLAPS